MHKSWPQNEYTGFDSEEKVWSEETVKNTHVKPKFGLLCYVIGQMKGDKQSGQRIGEKQSGQAQIHDSYAMSLVR